MRIEVLIPCYRSEHVIDRALASVRAQARPADVITVHDDASSDATVEIVSRHAAAHNRIRLLRSSRNLGILEARKRLVAESECDVLAFLDHDDEWPANYLQAVDCALSQPGVEASVACARNIDAMVRETSRVCPGPAPLRAAAKQEAIRRIFMEYPVPTWSCVAVRRESASRIAELSGFPSGEEFALLALALDRGDVQFLGDVVIDRHLGSGNASLNARKQHEAELALFVWFAARYSSLWPDLPAKMSAIYGNSVYRHLISGDAEGARRMREALLRGVFHPKVLGALGASALGSRALRRIRPPR